MYEGDQVFLPVQYMKLSTSAVVPSRKTNIFPWIDWIPTLCSTFFDIRESTGSGKLWLKYTCVVKQLAYFKRWLKIQFQLFFRFVYLVCVLRDLEGDVDTGPRCTEDANILFSVHFRYPVLMAMYRISRETFNTWNERNMAYSVMTITQDHSVERFSRFYFAFQILVRDHPDYLVVWQGFWLHVFHQCV